MKQTFVGLFLYFPDDFEVYNFQLLTYNEQAFFLKLENESCDFSHFDKKLVVIEGIEVEESGVKIIKVQEIHKFNLDLENLK